MSLPNPFPEARHPHRRRLDKHARHIIRQMLRPRAAQRAGTLQVQVRQLDSAVSLHEDRDRLHPDSDRFAPGVRVVVGPETRSLLVQLLASRDLRVQQQLVREIRHQILKKVLAAVKRAKSAQAARDAVARAAQGTRDAAVSAGRATRKGTDRLAAWFRSLPEKTRNRVARRNVRVVGNRPRTTTRTRFAPVARTRAAVGDGRETRARKPAPERTSRAART